VPKATVDKDRDKPPAHDDIGFDHLIAKADRGIDAIPEAPLV
jgi:hypothetical protein